MKTRCFLGGNLDPIFPFDRQVLTWRDDDHGLVAVHLAKTTGKS
jgi:hypothetical protein